MVGAVLVQGDRMLAEGWHHRTGGPHAEVNCLQRFRGRTGPCGCRAVREPGAVRAPWSNAALRRPDLDGTRHVKQVVVGMRTRSQR